MKMGRLTLMIAVIVTALFTLGESAEYEFANTEQTIEVLKGEDVEIECNINKLDDGARDPQIIWNGGTDGQVLGEGNDLWSENPRMDVYGGNGQFKLTLRDVEESDEGSYTCQIKRTNLKLVTQIVVNVEPSISETSFVDDQVYLDRGTSLELWCKAEGKPDPTISWRKVDGLLPGGQELLVGETLMLDNADIDADGDYECTATNGAGSAKTELVTVNVQFAPEVEVSEKFIHAGPGNEVTISCTFSANPEVYVEWYQNEVLIDTAKNSNIEISSNDEPFKQVASLVIKNLGQDLLGTYTCSGFNDLGNNSATVVLSAIPHNLRITSNPSGLYSDQYVLEWKVTSEPDLIEYHLKIGNKVNGTEQYAWVDKTIPAPTSQRKVRKDKYLLAELDVNQTYAIKLRAKNEFGMTEWSEIFEFKTSKDVNPAPPPTTSTVSTTETRTQISDIQPESTKPKQFPDDDEKNISGASSLCSVVSTLLLVSLLSAFLH